MLEVPSEETVDVAFMAGCKKAGLRCRGSLLGGDVVRILQTGNGRHLLELTHLGERRQHL